ncbi:MAG: hypothetical protein F4Y53_06230 [Proteobacteria bacterium]|nr:hypothetical protein [Pseudomonadota bacterium]
MPIQENALNSALAEALATHDVHAVPEQTRRKTGAKRCDVQIRLKHGDRYFTAVECKIGQGPGQKREAVEDAQRWLREGDCWNSIALCYPDRLSEDSDLGTSRTLLEVATDLLMARVNQGGVVGRWHTGNLADLVKLSNDIGANETYAITDVLKRAIMDASEQIDERTGRDLAQALELPWDPPARA